MKKAIGYVGVSTEEQCSDDKFWIKSQKKAIEDYARKNGYEIVYWSEDVISGVKDSRPELDKLLYEYDSLPSHEAVIVFKNDRMARDTKLYFYYFYTLEKRNVKLLSTEECFSEGDDFANIYRSLLMFVSEQERKNIAIRTSKARSLKAKCGGYSGGKAPYGYRVSNGALVIDHEEALLVKRIYELNEDHNMLEIVDILQQEGYTTRKGRLRFQPSTIKSILGNYKFYKGMYKYGDSGWVQGAHEPIL